MGLMRRISAGTGGGVGALGEIIDVFQPSHRTLVDEQERQRREIVQLPSADLGHGEIDLDSGVVVLAPQDDAQEAARAAEGEGA